MDNSFNTLERLIHFTRERHAAIASNISNADTPHYTAKDIKFENMLNSATMELSATDKNHISNSSGLAGEIKAEPALSWADQNNVELDMEVAKMTENAMLFQAGITLLSTRIKMFKNALRR